MRNRNFFFIDAVALFCLPFLALALRFEGRGWPAGYLELATVFACLSLPIRLGIAWRFGLYKTLWRHAGVYELGRIVQAGLLIGLINLLIGRLALRPVLAVPELMPISALILDGLLTIAILGGPRFVARLGQIRRPRSDTVIPTIVIGAGEAGQAVVREALNSPRTNRRIVAFLDDDPTKQGFLLNGVRVAGPIRDLRSVIDETRAKEIIIAMPSARGTLIRQILETASLAGITTRTVPSIADLFTGKVAITTLRPIEIQDLLRREPVVTDPSAIGQLITQRTVLITGAGGSIGSELCRQIAVLEPTLLVILDHSENQIFEIQGELARTHPNLAFLPVIADVRNAPRIREVFLRFRPFVVFHAAAHKHVPLMEENVIEAVTNNILGTRNVVDAAIDADVEHFVLISTDKAVRPTSIMGASKRIAEMVVRRAAMREGRHFVAVRFGNVLGSRGSVIPTFLSQIERGGPITVTHPEMRRYFMTIPEAVQLVLQAGALGANGELFVLDMGEPVRILDLARDLIRLSGLEEGGDIEIKFTGLRPGEKLYEEVLFGDEEIGETAHPKIIRVLADEPGPGVDGRINALIQLAQNGSTEEARIREMLIGMIPDFIQEPAPVVPMRRNVGRLRSPTASSTDTA